MRREWKPRPDNIDIGDQQASFFSSSHAGPAFLLGGNGAGTTETATAKMVEFLISTPPPRKDTPFWVIAGSYEQACETIWKEKLVGHDLLPASLYDTREISWLDKRAGRPSRVPLKPWPDYCRDIPGYVPGANWVLEFKSWRQGREQMQARSIGGFMFSEQFPWGLFTEVVARCREYQFVGNKLAEFTPVHPELSIELQELIEQDKVPPSWGIYYANTACALEAGHVTQQWYDDFFGMLPPDILPIRQRGLFGAFEGTIFPEFSIRHHVRDDSAFEFPPEARYGRAIDWGSGGEHPFGCLWYYRLPNRAYYVFDELFDTACRVPGDYLQTVNVKSREWGWDNEHPHYEMTWADTADPGAMLLATTFKEQYPDEDDIPVTGARKAVLPGIFQVQSHLKQRPEFGGGPGIIIHERCRNLIREMRTYRWMKSSPNALNPRAAPREPVKSDDHLVDCLRYAIYSEACHGGWDIKAMSRRHTEKQYGVK